MPETPQINDPLKTALLQIVADFVAENEAARVVSQGLKVVGIGMLPVLDHLCFLTADPETCIEPFLNAGYTEAPDAAVKVNEGSGRVYSRQGYPAIIVLSGGSEACSQGWTDKFSDKQPLILAVKVENIENAVFYLEKQGVAFPKSISGGRGELLRQAVALPKMKDGRIFSLMKLVERQQGFKDYQVDLSPLAASSSR